MNLGLGEIVLVVVVVLLLFGPGRLPLLGKSLGEAVRGLKKGMSGSLNNKSSKSKEHRDS